MNKLNKWVIGTYISLYIVISIVSTMHSVSFFGMTNDPWMANSLAAAFELGQLAAMAGLMTLEKSNKKLIVGLMITLTAMQIMANMFFSYSHVTDATAWFELFGLQGTDPIIAKRILAAVSGGLLPLIALGFIKSLVDYLKPDDATEATDAAFGVSATRTYSESKTTSVPLVVTKIENEPLIATKLDLTAESIIAEDIKIKDQTTQSSEVLTYPIAEKDEIVILNGIPAGSKSKKIMPLRDGTLPEID